MDKGTCELVGSALVAGLKSNFFFLGGFALLIVPALILTHVLLRRKTISAMNSPTFVLHDLVYFLFCISWTVIALTVFLVPIMGPLFLLYWLPAVLLGLLPFSVYIWIIRSRRYGSSETTTQRVAATTLIVATFVVAFGTLLIEPSFRHLLNEQTLGAYKPSKILWQGAFTKEECFERGGKSYGTFQGKDATYYYPDGTSKSEALW